MCTLPVKARNVLEKQANPRSTTDENYRSRTINIAWNVLRRFICLVSLSDVYFTSKGPKSFGKTSKPALDYWRNLQESHDQNSMKRTRKTDQTATLKIAPNVLGWFICSTEPSTRIYGRPGGRRGFAIQKGGPRLIPHCHKLLGRRYSGTMVYLESCPHRTKLCRFLVKPGGWPTPSASEFKLGSGFRFRVGSSF